MRKRRLVKVRAQPCRLRVCRTPDLPDSLARVTWRAAQSWNAAAGLACGAAFASTDSIAGREWSTMHVNYQARGVPRPRLTPSVRAATTSRLVLDSVQRENRRGAEGADLGDGDILSMQEADQGYVPSGRLSVGPSFCKLETALVWSPTARRVRMTGRGDARLGSLSV